MKNFKKLLAAASVTTLSLGLLAGVYASDQTELSITVNEGILTVSIVDNDGNVVASPTVPFGAVTTQFIDQETTASLGTPTDTLASVTQQILLANPTDTEAWTVAMAATGGPTAEWSEGTFTMDFNGAAGASEGRLTVNPQHADVRIRQAEFDPTTAAITGENTNTTGISAGTEDTYDQAGGTNSITLFSSTTGDDYNGYLIRGIELRQNVPAQQEAGNYTLDMTITAT